MAIFGLVSLGIDGKLNIANPLEISDNLKRDANIDSNIDKNSENSNVQVAINDDSNDFFIDQDEVSTQTLDSIRAKYSDDDFKKDELFNGDNDEEGVNNNDEEINDNEEDITTVNNSSDLLDTLKPSDSSDDISFFNRIKESLSSLFKKSSKKSQTSFSNEKTGGLAQKNSEELERYFPHPAVVVFNKNNKLSDDTKKEIINQIKQQTNKFVVVKDFSENNIDDLKKDAKLNTILTDNKLHIIEGQIPFSYSDPVTGNVVNWFSIYQKSQSTQNISIWQIESDNYINNPIFRRYAFPATFFKNKIYLASGWNGINLGCLPDVWHSPSGSGWLLDTLKANWAQSNSFDGRFEHTLTTFKSSNMQDAMYLIGGYSCGSEALMDDVWKSVDGIDWINLTKNNSVIGPRFGHSTISFNGKLYVLGGFSNVNGFLNDVISSSDGINWSVVNSNASWSPRGDHSSVVFNNKMWVIGGHYQGWPQYGIEIYADTVEQYSISLNGGVTWELSKLNYFNDVWSSSDGVKWQKENSENLFSGRRGHSLNVLNNKMYIIGGSSAPAQYLGDVYESSNGSVWNKISELELLNYNLDSSLKLAEHASVVTPSNFGQNILNGPPSVKNLSAVYFPNNIMKLYAGVFSTSPQTNSWFEYQQMPVNFSNIVFGLNNKTNQSILNQFLFGQIINTSPAGNNLLTYRAFAENSAGMKFSNYFSQKEVCVPGGKPFLGLVPINNGKPLSPRGSYLLEWTSCNMLPNDLVSFGLISNNGGNFQYFNISNSGSYWITIPSNFSIGSNYNYTIYSSIYNTGDSLSVILQ